MLVCGVDEAGRGSLMGPLVVAGVRTSRRGARRLAEMGVRDSKKLSPARREKLYGAIVSEADAHSIARVSPPVIDRSVRRHLLNHLEAERMAAVISRLGPDVAYVDACDVNAARFGRRVSSMVSGAVDVRSHHRADGRFAVVAAASILAKVARDRAVARIAAAEKGSGAVGSGYPSDRRSVEFARARIAAGGGRVPRFVRASWRPVRAMVAEIEEEAGGPPALTRRGTGPPPSRGPCRTAPARRAAPPQSRPSSSQARLL